MRHILVGDGYTAWGIGRASNEFIEAISTGASTMPVRVTIGRYDGPFINLYSSEVQIGIYQKMFLLAPEDRQITPDTIRTANRQGQLSHWYRQYLNLGY